MTHIQRYKVGGAVRDRLLGKPSSDDDWVIVGSSADALEAAGYQAIYRRGNNGVLESFPVFLHPHTRDEHALARRSLAQTGDTHDLWARFRGVSLEEDLANRDFTMNAVAQTPDGRLVDPFNGARDLDNKIIRHVSEAFAEDPVRVLRGARFAAQLPGFALARETRALFGELAERGDLDQLDPSRVWKEVEKSMAAPAPQRFIEVLRESGVLCRILPEVDALFGVPQPPEHHPEIDTGVHTLMVLEQAAGLSADPRVRFGALVHDLGKALTPPENWPSHHQHERRGLEAWRALARRMAVPNRFDKAARVAIEHHLRCHRLTDAKASGIARLLRDIGAYRDPEIVELLVNVCEADARGRAGREQCDYPQAALLTQAYAVSRDVTGATFVENGHRPGPAIGQMVIAEQVRRIATVLRRDRGQI